MAKSIMVQGTMSSVGKSLIVAGLCRIFKQDGYNVAPFKSQNMALNSFVTKEGLEMGRAQVMQAECCGIAADVRMNPILLKPVYENGSQVIVNGEVLGNMKAQDYFKFRKTLIPQIVQAYNSLAKENDIIVIEGAGSPAEINLNKDDIVNMGIAKLFDSPVILVGDIDRGGVFASVYGTIQLLKEDERKYVKSVIINKFRGDISILKNGIDMLENLININIAGVVPYMKINVDDEDSLSERFSKNINVDKIIDIVVIRFPMISNFTDFNCFENIKGISLRYVDNINDFGNPDLIILPGTKNTIDDLLWMRNNEIERKIIQEAKNRTPIIGICGGYQMLGTYIYDNYNVESGKSIDGMRLLNCDTYFEKFKTRKQVKGKFNNIKGFFHCLSNIEFSGYEIHMGSTTNDKDKASTFIYDDDKYDGEYNDNILGTYVHGIFDKKEVVQSIIKCICERKNINSDDFNVTDFDNYKDTQYNLIADTLRKSIDMNLIYKIIDKGI